MDHYRHSLIIKFCADVFYAQGRPSIKHFLKQSIIVFISVKNSVALHYYAKDKIQSGGSCSVNY